MKHFFTAMILVLSSFSPISIAGQMDIAINVDGIADWMSSQAFIDASVMFRRWGMPGAGWQENPALKLTPDNYPLADADAVSYLRGYPDGVYKLRYEGTGEVNFLGFASIVPGTLIRARNLTTADVAIKREGELITLQLRNIDPKNPVRNLQLLTPGYKDAKAVFTDAFIRRVRPFGTIRFMDWQQTNFNTTQEWKDRATPALFSRTTAKGVPIEEIVILANTTKRNVWVNIPLPASDDYVRQFATYLKEHLHKDAIIHFEYSNEVWNYSFQQAKDNLLTARKNFDLTKSDDFGRSAQQAADKLGRFARIFKEVFGSKQYDQRVRPVVGGGIAQYYWAQTQCEWLKEHHPGLVKELGIAPYFGVEGDIKDADIPGASAEKLFAKLDDFIDSKIDEWVGQHEKIAADFGLQLVAYEGGNHLTATNGINEQTKKAMQNDSRMAATYQHLFAVWQRHKGGLFTQFGHIAPYTQFGYWGLLEDVNQKGSVKWDFMMSKLLPPGDANLDGKVDWEDFKIMKAHFNKTPAYWEDGDFNGDGAIDREDAKLLKASLKLITPQQASELGTLIK